MRRHATESRMARLSVAWSRVGRGDRRGFPSLWSGGFSARPGGRLANEQARFRLSHLRLSTGFGARAFAAVSAYLERRRGDHLRDLIVRRGSSSAGRRSGAPPQRMPPMAGGRQPVSAAVRDCWNVSPAASPGAARFSRKFFFLFSRPGGSMASYIWSWVWFALGFSRYTKGPARDFLPGCRKALWR